jgi:hypothetical protein
MVEIVESTWSTILTTNPWYSVMNRSPMVFTNTPIGYLRDAEVAGPPSPPEVMEVPVPSMVLIVGGESLRIFFKIKSAMIRFPTVSKHKCCRLVEN